MTTRREQNGEPLLAESRRTAIIEMLRASGAVTVAEVQSKLGVSSMTARRDLAELARRGLAQRTHGGAVIPLISAHEDSFAQRLGTATDAKLALARAAVELLAPRDTVFLDSSTTSYFVARQILEAGTETTLLTNSLPVMQLVAAQAPPNIDLVAVGGLLRQLTQSFVGPYAVRTIQGHFTDHAFLSIKGLSSTGVLTDADPLEAEVKRAMVTQASQPVLLIDRSKLRARGLNAIGPASELSLVIAHGTRDDDLRLLVETGVAVRRLTDAPRSAGHDADSRRAGGPALPPG
jgi:DeoR/GlpR family transcriptional regulator of sugar metabolism